MQEHVFACQWVGVGVCFKCVFRVCMGVRQRWTAGVSVVLNHSPLPSMQAHTHTHIHTHTRPIPHRPQGNAPQSIPSPYSQRTVHTDDVHRKNYILVIFTSMTDTKKCNMTVWLGCRGDYFLLIHNHKSVLEGVLWAQPNTPTQKTPHTHEPTHTHAPILWAHQGPQVTNRHLTQG